MAGLDFHVRCYKKDGTQAVKQYRMCGCVTIADFAKTLTTDFGVPIQNVQRFDHWLRKEKLLEDYLPYHGGILQCFEGE